MSPSRRQRGVSALEFALSAGLLFGLFWALISYTLPLIVLQSMQRAVTEAARVAESVDIDNNNYLAAVQTVAAFELGRQTQWMPASWLSRFNPAPTSTSNITLSGTTTLVISLSMPNYASNPLVPAIRIPGLGTIPSLPTNLTVQARIQP